MDEVIKDDRFKHIVNDAKFKILPKNERKFKVDKRFKNMFHDKQFKLKYSVDKRGRPVNLTTNDNLKKFYQLPSDEEEDEDEDEKDTKTKNIKSTVSDKKGKISKDEQDDKDETDEEKSDKEDEKNESNDVEAASENDDGDDSDESESSESDSSDEDDYESSASEESGIEIPWNDFDKEAVREEKITSRLAVCNMDWDRIKAIDLFVLLNSFKAADGVIKSVKIYVSEYGKTRMEYEKLHGPQELTLEDNQNGIVEEENEDDDQDENGFNNSDDEEGSKFDRFKLRQYQFNRLKYYYAVVECDTCETANRIYTECDGLEYESSCTRLDLRFIGDDVNFDDTDLKEACTDAPDPLSYKPNLFITTALNQTKVECTWDETPRDRLAVTMKKYSEDELKNLNLKNLIATSSEEEDNDDEEVEQQVKNKKESNENKKNDAKTSKNKDDEPKDEEEKRIRMYRELLLGADDKKNKKHKNGGGLEFSWEGGMEEEGFNELLFNKKKSNSKQSNKTNKEKELTEEEKQEQAKLSLLTIDEEDGKSHFNLDDLLIDNSKTSSKKKKKLLKKNEEEKKPIDDFKMDLNDPRFSAIYSDHKFNIDPSDQSFKKTKLMETLLEEKLKRKLTNNDNETSEKNNEQNESSSSKNNSINLLVKSIKSKTEVLKRKKEEISNKKNKILKR